MNTQRAAYQESIRFERNLIWTLRDIKAKRTLLPIEPDHLRELIELDLVEMRDETPTLANKGHGVLD